MSNNSLVTNHLPEADGAVLEVTDHHVGQQIIDILRRTFTSNGMKQRGDFYRDQTRELLQRCLERIVDREFIYHMCKKSVQDAFRIGILLRCDPTGRRMTVGIMNMPATLESEDSSMP